MQWAASPCVLACAALALAQSAPQPIGDLVASQAGVQGSVVVAAGKTSLLSGASVEAGAAAAEINLRRGGMLRVCPRTTLTLSTVGFGSGAAAAPEFNGLMLSMGAGALEADYPLAASPESPASSQAPSPADSIVTPDFRLLLAGPAAVHLAVSVDGAGNTCIRTLAGNTANVMVSELLGSGTYLLKPRDAVEFANGNIANAHAASGACGCATGGGSAEAAGTTSNAPEQSGAQVPPSSSQQNPAAVAAPPIPPPAGNVPVQKPNQPPVEVEAPFVFNAGPPALPAAKVAGIKPRTATAEYPAPTAQPPPPQPTAPAGKPQAGKRHGFFSRVAGFFAHLFGQRRK